MSGKHDKVQALAQFIERRKDELLSALERMIPLYLKRTIAAEDILQQAFIEVQGGLDTAADLSELALFSFVLRSSRSRAVDAVRREFSLRQGAGRIEYPSALIAVDDVTPSRVVARREAVSAMIRQLHHLNERQLDMLQLHFVRGLSYDAIGKIVGGDAVSVRSVIFRARKRLATLMGPAGRYFTDA